MTSGVGRLAQGRATSPPSVLDVSAIRWATLLFLIADSTDLLVGVVSPGPIVGSPSVADFAQTLLGIAACAGLVWWRWQWALPMVVILTPLMVLHGPVGVEPVLLVVGTVASAAAAEPWARPLVLVGSVGFATALAVALDRENQTSLAPAVAVLIALGLASLGVGLLGRVLVRDRERARTAVLALELENRRIRAHERHALGVELEQILTGHVDVMRVAMRDSPSTAGVSELRALIARLGQEARTTLATVRVALHALRVESEQSTVAPLRAASWIDTLRTPASRSIMRLGSAVLLGGAVAQVAWSDTGAGPAELRNALVVVGSALSLVVSLWRVRVGLALAALVLVCGLTVTHPVVWVAVPAGLFCIAASRDGRWLSLATATAGLVGYMAATLFRFREDAVTTLALLEVTGVCCILVGLTVGHFEAAHRVSRSELETLHGERSRIETDERAGVARELHDVVGHHLSVVSLQALAAEQETDPRVLREGLRRMDDALHAGAVEIDQLVGSLRSDGDDPAPPPMQSPGAMVETLAEQLRDHAYDAHFAIDAAVDDLEPTTRNTVTRILQELVTNVLRHSPPESTCTFSATVTGGRVAILTRSAMGQVTPAAPLLSGYGLRGIRERVELVGGTFYAGTRAGEWEVDVLLRPPAAQADQDEVV